MPSFNPTFIFGLIVLLYLSSFVLFALVRIVTGISVQRIGYFSLRRLAYTPRDGCTIEIRGIGLNIHRPTFSQPTWLSIVLTELVVSVDIRELESGKRNQTKTSREDTEAAGVEHDQAQSPATPDLRGQSMKDASAALLRSDLWKHLTKIKERLKRLHRNVKWIRLVDVVANNSSLNIVDVGSIQVGHFTMAVDTRSKKVDRGRLFFSRTAYRKRKRQAEWIMTLRSVLFTTEGSDSLEILDHALLNIHGFLQEPKDGLRDTTISLKLGRVHVPIDDILLCSSRLKKCRAAYRTPDAEEPFDIFLDTVVKEVEVPGSTNGKLMRTVSDSKEFLSSILRGIKEVQFAISLVSATKKVDSIRPAASPILLSASMKEVGIDLHRLDSRSPAHRMYFPSTDIAHEALAAALSISVGLDDGHGKPERIVYIPMATTTIRTTLPSKTVEISTDESLEQKNANILFANSVVTSPSVDLDPRHLPVIIALLQPKPTGLRPRKEKRSKLFSRLLPKANVKFSMHEPVLRIKLKPLNKTADAGDFDLIISSISSISLDVESSHSVVEDLHYSLDGKFRLQSHHLYYQTNNDERFDLITTDTFDVKVQLNARPDVSVDATGNIQSFSISMVRPEIIDGLRQIVKELHLDVEPDKRRVSKTVKQNNFLRSMPDWLLRYHIEATDFNVEVAGIDEDLPGETRGVSLHMDGLSAEYRAQRCDGLQRRPLRRRAHSRSMTQSDSDAFDTPSSSSPQKKQLQTPGDGRRFTLHARGLEGQIVESEDRLEQELFLNVPRLEVIFSASSDKHGPLFHIQSSVRSFHLNYSLFRHYAVGVALLTLRKAFMRTKRDKFRRSQHQGVSASLAPSDAFKINAMGASSTVTPELTTVDFTAALVQVKADFPHEPRLMLHLYGLKTGRNRWSAPFLHSELVRLFVETPRMPHVWSKMMSIKSARFQLRESKHKTASGDTIEEKMVDIGSEAIRVAVPHEVIVSRITDNITNTYKTSTLR